MLKQIEGGVTAAKGFWASGVRVGIKESSAKKDMAMIYSEVPCVGAGTFTTNVVKAAPVKWDQELIRHQETAQAVVVNSGVANACTGAEGYGYCRSTAEKAAALLGCKPEEVLIGSTGVIGKQLPMDKILPGVAMLKEALQSGPEGGQMAAEAIMTTDTMPKQIAFTFEAGGKTITIGGMCKGSGMIHPNMCTMLGYITTDLNITKELLQEALSADIPDTFNMVSVDGDTSTNDTVLLLANGLAGNEKITEKNADYYSFTEALRAVNTYLSKKIAGDGEGATALFEVKVVGAETKAQAVTLAKSVVMSSLTKAMIFGHDANFGRVLCAMGYSGVQFDPEKVDLTFESAAGTIRIAENGVGLDFDEEEATRILSEPEVTVVADVKMGTETATAWGCDLTYDYVKINADYRS